MSRATWAALLVMLTALMVVSAIAVNYYLMARYVGHVDGQWCDTLRLLTSRPVGRPVNPASNPSRVEAYTLYEEFVKLRNDFRCGS